MILTMAATIAAAIFMKNYQSIMEIVTADTKLLNGRTTQAGWEWVSPLLVDDFTLTEPATLNTVSIYTCSALEPIILEYQVFAYRVNDGVPETTPCASARAAGSRVYLANSIHWYVGAIYRDTVQANLYLEPGSYLIGMRPKWGVDAWGETLIQYTLVSNAPTANADGIRYVATAVMDDGVVGTWGTYGGESAHVMMEWQQ